MYGNWQTVVLVQNIRVDIVYPLSKCEEEQKELLAKSTRKKEIWSLDRLVLMMVATPQKIVYKNFC